MGTGAYAWSSAKKTTQPTWISYMDVHCKVVQFCHPKHVTNKNNT